MSLENPMMGKVWQKTIFRNSKDIALSEEGHLAPNLVRSVEADGVVDTGAAMVVLTTEIAQKLGLPKVGETTVRYADLRTAKRDIVGQLEIEIQGRRSTFRAVVEPSRKDPLIGVIVLEDLDFLIDPRNQKLLPRDPAGEVYEIE